MKVRLDCEKTPDIINIITYVNMRMTQVYLQIKKMDVTTRLFLCR